MIYCNTCGKENPVDARYCFSCGSAIENIQVTDTVKRKDPLLAALFGFLFGAFGLFYISPFQGFVGLGVLLAVILFTGGIGAILLWMGCAIWGAMAANDWNDKHGV